MDAQSGEVKLELERFGLGNVAREGDWAGLRVRLQDTALKPRDIIIRVSGFDADGDVPWYERAVSTNPGVVQGTWVYVRLPFDPTSLHGMSIAAFEGVEASDGGEGGIGFRAGRLLGRVPLSPRQGATLDPATGVYYVMGPRTFGLTQYSQVVSPGTFPQSMPLGHEVTQVVAGLTPADLPDQWTGLANASVLVWGNGEITELRAERAKAVRQWVMRGGHLVVILPAVGQAWTNSNSNELYDIMPDVSIQRREGVDLSVYRPLLTSDPKLGARMPKSGVVQVFEPSAGGEPRDAIRVLNGPDGACVAARRLVGAGAVTLVGLDLNQGSIEQAQLVDADVFWNRVLGRRGSTSVSYTQLQQISGAVSSNRTAWQFDQDIPELIAQRGQAAAGVAMGFIVFVLYWLIAGPVGFGLLKAKKWTRHAWVSFVLASAVFTATAWGGATLLKPSKVSATHVTFVDHVYGQSVQRARGWFSVLIPSYGLSRISAGGDMPELGANLVTAWEPYRGDVAPDLGSFPDVRGYAVDGRAPSSIRVPTRATSKQVEVDWAGGPRLKGPRPVADESGAAGVIRLLSGGAASQPLLSGSLVHELPGTLQNVYIIVVQRQTDLNDPHPTGKAIPSGLPQVNATAFVGPASGWPPNVPLALDQLTRAQGTGGGRFALAQFTGRFVPEGGYLTAGQRPDPAKAYDRFAALALYPVLNPPDPQAMSDIAGSSKGMYSGYRTTAHSWDLGRWFTQPCVIVMGMLGEGAEGRTASPIPLAVDGREIETKGLTYLRWVYPLPDNPPAYPAPGKAEADAGAAPEAGPGPQEPR